MCLVHHDTDAVDLEQVIVVLRLVEAQHIRKSGAAASFYPHAQTVVGRNIFLLANRVELFDRSMSKHDRSGNGRCIEQSFHQKCKIINAQKYNDKTIKQAKMFKDS